jgi:hypothetical protein
MVEESTIGNHAFEQWLSDEIRISVPPSTGLILTVDNGRSSLMAEKARALIKDLSGRETSLISLDDLLQYTCELPGDKNASVLVICSEESSGETLLSASRALREAPHLHRHYLLGHMFPDSFQQYERLKSNLRVSGKERQYGWSAYCTTPVGEPVLHQSWHNEAALLNLETIDQIKSNLGSALTTALCRRVVAFQSGTVKGAMLFLPSVHGEGLKLRPGSVFFDGQYDNMSQVTVYVLVAATLQRARDGRGPDDKPLAEHLCFQSNPFIDTVLDPDVFSRFNDGVIQAAFLRACSPSELNYSRSRVLSQHMVGIIQSVVNGSLKQSGEAALEFVFALALKKLRLLEDHYKAALSWIDGNSQLATVWKLLKKKPLF